MKIKRINITKIFNNVKPQLYSDGSNFYMVQVRLDNEIKNEMESNVCGTDATVEQMKDDLKSTIKCAVNYTARFYDGLITYNELTVFVNGVDVTHYIEMQ